MGLELLVSLRKPKLKDYQHVPAQAQGELAIALITSTSRKNIREDKSGGLFKERVRQPISD